jgi:phosphatidate phosphatase APP1
LISEPPLNKKEYYKRSGSILKLIKNKIYRAFQLLDYPFISSHRGYSNGEEVVVSGHVFRSFALKRERSRGTFLNSIELIKRFLVRTADDVEVCLSINNNQQTTKVDANGYFEFRLKMKSDNYGWQPYRLELKDTDLEETISVENEILNCKNSGFAVVSDIDDTFLVSHSTRFFKKLYLLASKNVQSRKAFEGVAEFYQTIEESGDEIPFFYVSSSEWNLYDFLVDFCELNDIPRGVYFLNDLKSGLREVFNLQGGSNHDHKRVKIEKLLSAFPNKKFILIGDSGQKDLNIYYELSRHYPQNIMAVYIRRVKKRSKKKIKKIETELSNHGIDFKLFRHSRQAQRHFLKNIRARMSSGNT